MDDTKGLASSSAAGLDTSTPETGSALEEPLDSGLGTSGTVWGAFPLTLGTGWAELVRVVGTGGAGALRVTTINYCCCAQNNGPADARNSKVEGGGRWSKMVVTLELFV